MDNQAKEQAESANRAKDQFIANLSQELRTPLTPILATVERLAREPDFPETLKPYLELIRRNVEIEARLIDDLAALPMARPAVSQTPATAHSALPKSRSGRILMVDDHVDTNAALKVLLERRGYKVTTASTVATGLELARLHPFDILVSDIGLPDGDGIDLLRAIRANGSASPKMHAIAVSGYGSEADVERSLQAGFKLHLRKPIAFPDLERAIAEVLAGT